MQRTRQIGRVDEGLLEGPAWWCPWLAVFSAALAASATLFIPEIRSWWVLPLVAVLLLGSVGAWRGISRGNAPQRAVAALGVVLILGLSGLLTRSFFAVELGQGVSSATSTTGMTDY